MQVTRATFIPLLAAASSDRLDPDTVREEYSADLTVVYTAGPQFGRRVVTHADLEQMELAPRVLRRSAFEHLEVLSSRAEFHGQPPALMLSFEGLESSLLLASDFWARLQGAVPGEIVVGVPARDVVIVTGSKSTAGLEKARRCVERVFMAGGENPLSPTLLVRRGNNWEPFDRPARPARGGGRGLGAAHQLGVGQPPRQYQEHASWPGERVPVAPVRPAAAAARPAPGQRPMVAPAAQLPQQRPSGHQPPGLPPHVGPQMPRQRTQPGRRSVDRQPADDVAPYSSVPYSSAPYQGATPRPGAADPRGSRPMPTGPGSTGVGGVAPYSSVPYSAVPQPQSSVPYSSVPYSATPYPSGPQSVAPQSAVPQSAPRSAVPYARPEAQPRDERRSRAAQPDYSSSQRRDGRSRRDSRDSRESRPARDVRDDMYSTSAKLEPLYPGYAPTSAVPATYGQHSAPPSDTSDYSSAERSAPVAASREYDAPAPGREYSAPAANGYSAPAANGYGAQASNGYGAAAANGYGAAANGYGAAASNGYGAAASNGYGAQAAPAGYATSASPAGYATSAAPAGYDAPIPPAGYGESGYGASTGYGGASSGYGASNGYGAPANDDSLADAPQPNYPESWGWAPDASPSQPQRPSGARARFSR